MRGLTSSLTFVFLSLASSAIACVDPEVLAHSAVSITRYFDDTDRPAEPGLNGIQGTGWFQSPSVIVTVEHVAIAMGLSKETPKLLTIQDGNETYSVAVRIRYLAGEHSEKLAVLELQTAISTARSVPIRMLPLSPEEQLLTLAYPQQRQRFVSGRFVQYGTEGTLAGSALLEMYDGNNRLAIDHGASGAPVFDCDGRLAAVITTVITQIFPTPFGNKRISTAWGTPNVVSVPIDGLTEFRNAPPR